MPDQHTRSTSGLVLEFWGRPGAGKSTLARLTFDNLRRAGVPVASGLERRSRLLIHGERLFGFVACLAVFPQESLAVARCVSQSEQRGAGNRRAVLIKLLAKYCRFRLVHGRRGVVLTDEGIIQALWSMHYSAARRTAPYLAATLSAAAPAHWLVVEIDVDEDLWTTRLLERRWRPNRLTADLSADASRAVSQARAATDDTRFYINMLEDAFPGTFTSLRVANDLGDPERLASLVAAQTIRLLRCTTP